MNKNAEITPLFTPMLGGGVLGKDTSELNEERKRKRERADEG